MVGTQPKQVRTRNFAQDNLRSDAVQEVVGLRASDGGESFGALYTPMGASLRTCVVAVHPRSDYTRMWIVPGLVQAGFPVLGLTTRFLNNDTDGLQELMLLDLAAAMRELRARGAEQIVLWGHSGGGSLTTFYQAQASRSPEARIGSAPSGERVELASEDMPLAVAQMQVAVHPGEGEFMRAVIDPSVVDERDPLLTEPSLDMYDTSNGKRPYPEPSTYDRRWLEAYRAEQVRRCARIDAVALAAVGRSKRAREIATQVDSTIDRAGLLATYLVVYRTLANPTYLDPTLDPSDRILGSSFAHRQDPIVANYGYRGLGRTLTPRAWLSSWSPACTQTRTAENLAEYDIPTLLVNATGDTEIRPSEFDAIVAACAATDIESCGVVGDHNLHAVPASTADPRAQLDIIMAEWLSRRFDPART